MQPIYFYFITFGTGVLCSLLVTYFAVKFNPIERKNYLSEEHYLQVRDDYSIYSPSANQLIEEHLEQSDRTKKQQRKNKDEGTNDETPQISIFTNKYVSSFRLQTKTRLWAL